MSAGAPNSDKARPRLRVLDLFAGLRGWSQPWRAAPIIGASSQLVIDYGAHVP